MPDRWPADFATRELLAVDTSDLADVHAFAEQWGRVVELRGDDGHWTHDDEREAGEIAWAQRCAVVVREIAIAAQQGRDPRTSVLTWALGGDVSLVDSATGEPVPLGRDAPAELVEVAIGTTFVEAFLSDHLQWAYPRLVVVGQEREPEPDTWAEAVAGQLYNYVSQRTHWQQCVNEPAHPNGHGRWFTVHRTDRRRAGGYGPRDAGSARFCSRQCARAFTERERRRRAREQREAGQQ